MLIRDGYSAIRSWACCFILSKVEIELYRYCSIWDRAENCNIIRFRVVESIRRCFGVAVQQSELRPVTAALSKPRQRKSFTHTATFKPKQKLQKSFDDALELLFSHQNFDLLLLLYLVQGRERTLHILQHLSQSGKKILV